MKTLKAPNTDISIAALNDACKWRAETLWTKEPATIGWLGTLTADDVLWDIGANIGLYSLFAASRGARVIAFEPMIPNLFALWQNLLLNPELAKLITIAPVALSTDDGFAELHLSSNDIASSCHSAGFPTNFRGERKDHWQGSQGTFLGRADHMDPLPQPTAVKIDVDGLEHNVIAGFGERLTSVRTWCIETNWNIPIHQAMIEHLQGHGFDYDPAQYAAAQRKDGAFMGVGEMILHRNLTVRLTTAEERAAEDAVVD